jgi:hypothetical protein
MFHLRRCLGAALLLGFLSVSCMVPAFARGDEEPPSARFHFGKSYWRAEQDRIPPAMCAAASRPVPHSVAAGEVSLPPNMGIDPSMFAKPLVATIPASPLQNAFRFGAPRQIPATVPIVMKATSVKRLEPSRPRPQCVRARPRHHEAPAPLGALAYKPGMGYESASPVDSSGLLRNGASTNCYGRLLK